MPTENIAASRRVRAVIEAEPLKRGVRQFPVQKVEAFTIETAIDNDADAFSIDVGDPFEELAPLRLRDVEVRVNLFSGVGRTGPRPIFAGIADQVITDSDGLMSIVGRDYSCLATDTDAPPGKWRNVKPKRFIQARATKLGFGRVQIPRISEIGKLHTDASESEWAFWYRMARMKKMWMWTEPTGALVINKLGYALRPSYYFGEKKKGPWRKVSKVVITKSNQGRVGEVWVYAEDAEKGTPYVALGRDRTIARWTRRPLRIMASTSAKSTADVKREAQDEIFESIVGATEIEITVRDVGTLFRQNRIARVDLPRMGLGGMWFIVGARSQGGQGSFEQVLRLRQKAYALSRRVPEAPAIEEEADPAETAIPASLGDVLASMPGVRWADSFVRAAREHGVKNGWDFAQFLGVLLALCQHESGFKNIRGIVSGYPNRIEWYPNPKNQTGRERTSPDEPPTGGADWQEDVAQWRRTFANQRGNPLNPRGSSSNTAVGPMQLVSDGYVRWADEYGWNGVKKVDEYEGGRWNPDSNIRAGARALIEKLNVAPRANPLQPNSIWIGVERYYGHPDATERARYVASIKKIYDTQFQSMAEATVIGSQKLPPGTGTNIQVPGYGQLPLPKSIPNEIKKALNFCFRRLGDRYVWGGAGPNYDCSSFVTAALASASPEARAVLVEPDGRNHGDNTHSLFRTGRFPSIPRDKLLPGDLVFFSNVGHVAMYIVDGLIVHARNPVKGVMIDSMSEGYYRDSFVGARRVIKWPAVWIGSVAAGLDT